MLSLIYFPFPPLPTFTVPSFGWCRLLRLQKNRQNKGINYDYYYCHNGIMMITWKKKSKVQVWTKGETFVSFRKHILIWLNPFNAIEEDIITQSIQYNKINIMHAEVWWRRLHFIFATSHHIFSDFQNIIHLKILILDYGTLISSKQEVLSPGECSGGSVTSGYPG